MPRSTFYYEAAQVSAEELYFMFLIDQIHTKWPFYGSRRITNEILHASCRIGRNRVRRLMKVMGIEVNYPKKAWKKADKDHRIFPYLLKDFIAVNPNEVWCSDITFIPTKKGYFYLVAVMDWYSRYVLAWELSNSMDVTFCTKALKRALEKGIPRIFNTDQGSQFTSDEFTQILLSNNVEVSMDHKGRCFDNIFIERLWRSLKYEAVYLQDYEDGTHAYEGIEKYFSFYNNERMHTALQNKTPKVMHFEEFAKR